MVTGDKNPRGSYTLDETCSTLRLVTNCLVDSSLLEVKEIVSVEGSHFKPRMFTIPFVSAVPSFAA